jgi:glycosyltransferase involved in cell wall biosynthesis
LIVFSGNGRGNQSSKKKEARLKLCFLANAASIHTRRWTTYFAEHGYDVTVLSLSEGTVPGVPVWRIGQDPATRGRLAYLLAVPAVRRALKTIKPDVVHAHYAGGYGLLGALAGRHPLVVSAWGSDVLVVPRAEPLMRWVIKQCLNRADLVTSVAVHMTATMRALGVKVEILTNPLGVDTANFHPRTGTGAGLARLDEAAAPLLVSTRHLEPIYNMGLLIEAMPEILLKHPNATAAILGAGSLRAELEARTRQLGIANSVTFVGRKTEAEVAEYLSRADVYVSTSLSDGNNISLNEAMACGAFPVVTDIPANREWIEDGRTGYLVDTRDPGQLAARVIEALNAPELRSRAAERNWEVVRQGASWKNAMRRMEMEYAAVLERRGHPALAS